MTFVSKASSSGSSFKVREVVLEANEQTGALSPR